MKALIFGANGQDGYYLNRLLSEQQVTTICVSRKGTGITGSVADYNLVQSLVKEHRPDYIFHLAANSTTRYDVIFENHETISTGTLNILDAVKKYHPEARVFLSGSGLQFVNEGKPIHEQTPFDAPNPYSVSRIQSVYAGRYFRTLGLKVYAGYFFNHESPRRTEKHISKMTAEAIKKIAAGGRESITIGDLSTRKEWTYAGDVVQAVWTLVNQENVFEAVIGSGIAYSIQDWLNIGFRLIGKDPHDYVLQKEGFRAEYEVLVSDPALIKGLGWNPKVDIETLARWMILENTPV